MCFIERETRKFILKLRKIFSWRESVLRVRGMKSDEKPFNCQIYAFFPVPPCFVFFWGIIIVH